MLLLFDIDGTLLLTHGASVRAMERAGQKTWGPEFSLKDVMVSGGMDPWLIEAALQRVGHTLHPSELEPFEALYDAELEVELRKPETETRLLPGVSEILHTTRKRAELSLALLTGNFEKTGTRKLRAVGIDPDCFELRVWGDQSRTRPGLVEHARQEHARLQRKKGQQQSPDGPTPGERVVVIGDTPRDVDCAKQNGGFAVGVCTGYFEEAALRDAGADLVMPDLSDTGRFWTFIDRLAGIQS